MKEFPKLNFDLTRYCVQKQSESISYGRRIIGKMLLEAEMFLPSHIRFLIKECYRPLSIQKQFWERYSKTLENKFPEWTQDKRYEECSKLISPVDVAPHATGGAVDLTLVDLEGNLLDMGTGFNASPLETKEATYLYAKHINDIAKTNRKILAEAMTTVGFVNYPTEWWHWSYGDKYWAFITGNKQALFNSCERN